MSDLQDIALFNKETAECGQLFQSLVDGQKNPIALLYKNTPLLFNKAFQHFFDFTSVKEFMREFGSLESRFVPHNAYFHAGKAGEDENWTDVLMALPEHDRIVSMINSLTEPHAFSVAVDTPVPDYTIVTFTDISQDLIKRIMIENDVSIDKASGAYDKEYFIHTAKSFNDAAEFNEKAIGITMIELMSSDADAQTYLRDFTSSIKSSIRQSDMLVRWGKKVFLLAYLVDSEENALKFSQKLLTVMRQEPFESLNNIHMRLGTSVQKNKEDINELISKAEEALSRSGASQTTVL